MSADLGGCGPAANIKQYSSFGRDRPCRVFNSHLRVRVPSSGLATYPDVSVVRGQPRMDDEDPEGTTLVNPCFLVEVLSPSTESYDRGDKLLHYKQLSSLESSAAGRP